MDLIDDSTRNQLRVRLADLAAPVELRLYRSADSGRLVLPAGVGCATCDATEELLRALADASAAITLFVIDVSASANRSIDVPSVTVAAPGEEPRIRFQGLPAGYEFATLLDAIERVSAAAAGLAPEVSQELAQLDEDVEVMVFVTPTCPYCPSAASMANRMAISAPRVRSVVVEANEFDSLSRRFGVQGVPKTVVNKSRGFVGALPEKRFVQAVLELAGKTGDRFVPGGDFE